MSSIEKVLVLRDKKYLLSQVEVGYLLSYAFKGRSHDCNKKVEEDDNQEHGSDHEYAPNEIVVKHQTLTLNLVQRINGEVAKRHPVGIDKRLNKVISNKAMVLTIFVIEALLHNV